MVNIIQNNPDLKFFSIKKPKTKKNLQRLLGKVNWYRQFIPNISKKLQNLYSKLSTKSNKIYIKDEEMNPIDEIYNHIKLKIFLYIPDLNKKILYMQMQVIMPYE
ncbi:Transposon Ty3-G Gag-Pol polyprotein [Dictyocoela muelleri]|nr:Transposon Ty3-G Gag-Pol polyprotein [Dictyocoela muelleri]